jgi:protein-disulfide isomerase
MRSNFCLVLLLLPSLIGLGCAQKESNAPDAVGADGTTERQAYLKANIQYHLRDGLGGRTVAVGAIEDSAIPGFDKSSFSVGRDQYSFLVSDDDEYFVLLAAEPFKNISGDEMVAALEAEKLERTKASEDRVASLAAASLRAPVRGNPNAEVTIVEFSDFECPYCRRGFDTMEQLLEKHGEEVRLVYMHFPLSNHPWAMPSAIASTCAAQQSNEAFWTLHDFYFRNQNEIEVDNLIAKSRGALAGSGINIADWETCSTDGSSESHKAAATLVNEQFELGSASEVSGTPAFFVNGTFISGAQPLEVFEAAMAEAKR